MEIFTEIMKTVSTKFTEWVDESFCKVHSKKLNKSMWVNCIENPVYVHGSDEHFTELIEKHGKTIGELYDIFIEEERKRLISEKEKSEQK